MKLGKEWLSVGSLATLYALRMLGLFMILPVLALYDDSRLSGATPAMIGLALGAYGITQAIFQIPFGFLSDRLGRKPVIAFGLLVFALGSVVAALSDNIYGIIIGRCLQGGGAIASTLMALLADLTKDEHRTQAMAVVGASIGLSFTVALLLGPFLDSLFGLSGVFWVIAMLACLGIIILYCWIPTPKQTLVHRDAKAIPGQFRPIIMNRDLLGLNLGIFVLHFILMANFVGIPLILLNNLDLVKDNHWQIYLPVLLLSFLFMIPFIIVAEKKRKIKEVFILAIVILVLAETLLLRLENSFQWVFMALFVFFVGFNLLEALLPSLISKTAPAGSKGTAMGVYSTAQFLGAFCGGALGGWIMQSYDFQAVLIATISLISIWLLVSLFMRKPKYLIRYTVSLDSITDENLLSVKNELSAIDGIEEVIVILGEKTAYLRVDKQKLDNIALKGFALVRA